MTALRPCRFCDESHDPVKTEAECDLTTARTIYGRWLIVEQQIAAARAALQLAEKEIALLDLIDGDLTEEQAHFKAAWDGACSDLTVADAFTALLVRMTGAASGRAEAVVSRERALAIKRAEAEQAADACERCGASGAVRTIGGGAAAEFRVCAECERDERESEAKAASANGGAHGNRT